MNLFSIILIFIVLAYESHTKVGEKMKILIERLKELWEGKKDDDKKKKKDPSVVKVSQPISRAGMPTQHAPSRARQYPDWGRSGANVLKIPGVGGERRS